MHKVGYIDSVQAKGLTLYSTHLVNGSDHTGHPDESLARESIFSQPDTGCKFKVKIYMASNKPNTVGEICCCQLLVLQLCLNRFQVVY